MQKVSEMNLKRPSAIAPARVILLMVFAATLMAAFSPTVLPPKRKWSKSLSGPLKMDLIRSKLKIVIRSAFAKIFLNHF